LLRSVILAAAALAVLPAVALAQTSRVEGMAIQGDYIRDYTGIYTYTSCITNVGNLIYGELGINGEFGGGNTADGVDDRAVGAVLGNLFDGRYGTWGIHMREVSPNLGQGDQTSHPGLNLGFDPNFNRNEAFDLMWGKKFGTTSFGVRLNRSWMSGENDLGLFDPALAGLNKFANDDPLGNPNTARNVLGISGGMGFEVNANTNAEFSVLWQSRTFENVATNDDKFENDGSTSYLVAGRAFWQWQPNVTVVPVFKWYSFDLGTRSDVGGTVTTTDASLRGWQLGAAGNWALGQNDLFVLGVTFAQNRWEQSSSGVLDIEQSEMFAPQVFAALETHVNDMLTLRFGGSKAAFYTEKREDNIASTSAEMSSSPFEMSLGAGVKVGALQLDAVINDRFAHVGPYLFSGASAGPIATKVTATYPF
jgi:hypothetical protein